MIELTDPRGKTTTFTYDTVGRLVKASDSAPGAGSIDFAYDILDRLIQETTGQGTVAYQYDVLGRRTQMIANGQQPTTYQYDAASRLTLVAQGSVAVGLGYDPANRRTSLTYPNGTSTSFAYDLASRLTGITHDGPSGIIEALTYQYDAAGNRTSLTRSNAAASLLPAAVASATYDAANEQTAFAGAMLTYDQNGNLTNDGVNTYQWDARNRLVSISAGATASFNYDALGRRISKTLSTPSSARSTGFLYDGNDITAEIGGGAVGANYLRSLGVDRPFIRQTSSFEFYHVDALGTTLDLTNEAGAIKVSYQYEAFGQTTIAGTSLNPFQYTGRENDGTGLYYHRARYYSTAFGRFISEDPILVPFTPLDVGLCRKINKTVWQLPARVKFGTGGPPQFLNQYAYVMNNPVMSIDPSGLECVPSPDQAELCRALTRNTPYAVCAGTAYNDFGALDCQGNPTKQCMRTALSRALAQCQPTRDLNPDMPLPAACTTGMLDCIENSKLPEYTDRRRNY